MKRFHAFAVALFLLFSFSSASWAAVKAQLEKSGKGVQIVVTGLKGAKAVVVKGGGKKFTLKKKGARWLSAILTNASAKAAGVAAQSGKINIQTKKPDGKAQNFKTALKASAEVLAAASFGGARPAQVTGGAAVAAFQARISGRIIRWVDNPASYNSSDTWGLAPNGQAVTYYFSPSTVGTSVDQKYHPSWQVIGAVLHPAALPGAAMVGQIKLGDDYYNIAFFYAPVATNNPNVRWEGAYAKVGSSSEFPFYTIPFVSESQITP